MTGAQEEEKSEPTPPARNPNKLQEWGLALLIMVILSGILFLFLSLFRPGAL